MDHRDTNSIVASELDAAEEACLDAEAIASGRAVPRERVREWLMKLAKGERVPRA